MRRKLTPALVTAALVIVITMAFVIDSGGIIGGRLLLVGSLPLVVACAAAFLGWEGRRGRKPWRPLVILESAALLLLLASGLYLVIIDDLARSMENEEAEGTINLLNIVECELYDEWCIMLGVSGAIFLFLVILDLAMKPDVSGEVAAPEDPGDEPARQK